MTEGVLPVDDVCLVERLGVQRRVILEQAEILEALGFDDSGVAAMLSRPETQTPPREQGRLMKLYTWTSGGYLLLDLLSAKVPGPMSFLGVDTHVRLFQHLADALQWLA